MVSIGKKWLVVLSGVLASGVVVGCEPRHREFERVDPLLSAGGDSSEAPGEEDSGSVAWVRARTGRSDAGSREGGAVVEGRSTAAEISVDAGADAAGVGMEPAIAEAVCFPGDAEPCNEHPGLDGRGSCRAGFRTCLESSEGIASWGECEGSVGPAQQDGCDIEGRDDDCDGTPNAECVCVERRSVSCGPSIDEGICEFGVSQCLDGRFSACSGAVYPTGRDCSSRLDNDCDGVPDDATDSFCTCRVGDMRDCGAHPGLD